MEVDVTVHCKELLCDGLMPSTGFSHFCVFTRAEKGVLGLKRVFSTSRILQELEVSAGGTPPASAIKCLTAGI
jgi:hypothetical protein